MVGVYDDILSPDTCENLIRLFEDNSDQQEYINHDHKPCFTQINLNQHHMGMVKSLMPNVRFCYEKYKKDTSSFFLPRFSVLEEFRVKRYLPNGEERFDEHVDVATHASAIRALAFLFYLNENDGKTVFTHHELSISPICGRVVVFSPTWEYPHAGIAPTDNTKYIMSTYLHYGSN
tara:strand:- start:736 stop:1263 length:528 start_codon:yes stop_codon:yes gene_type:complete